VSVNDIRRFRQERLSNLKDAVHVRRIVRRQIKHPKLLPARARSQCARLRAYNHLLMPTRMQAASQQQQLVLTSAQLTGSIDMDNSHWSGIKVQARSADSPSNRSPIAAGLHESP
jgi:hypothetical protein